MAKNKNRREVAESLLRQIVKRPDFPVFAEHITQVMVIAEDDGASLRQITNVILKDFSLTLKVLRTANSPYYNRSGKAIVTVTHAVALLGLTAIRDLAGSMLLFQHYRRKSAGLKELMLLSLLTASHARATAARIGYPRLEEAYLCGMFRNLGEVLVAGYLSRRYAAILARMKKTSVSEHAACLRVLECSYEDFGRAAARFWRMPKPVAYCMGSGEPRLTKTVNSETDRLKALTSFSHGLTEAIYRREQDGVRGRLSYLLMTHGSILSLGRQEIQQIAEEAISEGKSTFDLVGVPLDDLKLRKQTSTAMQSLDDDDEEAFEEAEAGALAPGQPLLERLTEEVELVLSSGAAFEVTNIILMILEAMYRGVPCDHVLFGLVSQDHQVVQGRLGLGQGIDELLERFRFPLSIRSGPVAVALLGKQDILAEDGHFSDSEFVSVTGSSRFGLLPVVVHETIAGCLYFSRESGAARLDPEIIHLLLRLRDLAAKAIQASREPARESV